MDTDTSDEAGSQRIIEARTILEEEIGAKVLDALQVFVDARIKARLAEFFSGAVEAESSPNTIQSMLHLVEEEIRDPFATQTATEIGEQLGVSEEAVQQLEASGELFSIMRPGGRGREYPAFQAWDGIAGKALADILRLLQPASGAMAFGFFSGKTMDLEDCAPIEILLGKLLAKRPLRQTAHKLLQASYDERLAYVQGSAVAYRHEVRS